MWRFRFLYSRTARQASALRHHARKFLNAQRDQLSPPAAQKVSDALKGLDAAIRQGADRQILRQQMAALEQTTGKWLLPYPHAATRENIEVLLVAGVVALSIHTFFFKPFKIPTGSMQPTLYGITARDLREEPDAAVPNRLARFFDYWIKGMSYYHVVAQSDGHVEAYEPPRMIVPFCYRQRFRIGGTWYSVWSSWDRLLFEGGVSRDRLYHKGEDILKLEVFTGDHLFVNRIAYNFRRPRRGEIIVFKTEGIIPDAKDPATGRPLMPQDQFYVKRLIALPGESVQINDDRHVVINGREIRQQTPHFENLYAFDPKAPPRPSRYSGHLNGTVARQFTKNDIAPLFPNQNAVFTVRPNHYLVLGDNTLDSFDGRSWGDFSRTNIIGKYCFVYWPFTDRFGWAVR